MSREDHLDKHDQLREAIKKGNRKAAKQLILNNALADNSNQKSSEHSLLHWAIIKFQDTEIAEILLNQKVSINAKNHRRQTPLDLAVQRNRPRVVELLLNRGAHVGEDLRSLIHNATTNGNVKVVKLLVDYGVENNSSMNLNNSLNLAIEKGHVKIVKCIIPHCTFKKKDKKQISKNIVSKAGQQYNECIEVLLQHGFSIKPGSEKDNSFIYSAVENGYSSIVRELLLLGIDVNMRYEKTGLNLLHVACLNKHLKIAELLVKHNADVNFEFIKATSPQEDSSSSEKKSLVVKTALHIAIDNLDTKLTKLLLDGGATIKNDSSFFTVTSIAVQNECKEIIEIFLKHGVDVNATDADGRTLLHLCSVPKSRCYSSSFESRPSRFNYSNKHEIAELLLKKGANVNAQDNKGETPLFTAIKERYMKMIEIIINHHADVSHKNVNDDTPLHLATEDHWVDIKTITLLLNHNANVNVTNRRGVTPLISACCYYKLKIVQMLLNRKAKVNVADKDGMTPLHFASLGFNLDIIESLVENGAVIDAKDNNGRTPLHIACDKYPKCAAERIKLLLHHKADINAVDAEGRTPLFYACKEGDIPIVKLVLANKADVNHVDLSGVTPIYVAAEYSPKIVKLLLKRKSTNVDFITNKGKSLLHILAEQNRVNIVENFMDRIKVDINLMDKSGKTALHYAAAKGHRQIVASLLKHGADINVSTEKRPTVLFLTSMNIFSLEQEFIRYILNRDQYLNLNEYILRTTDSYQRKINSHTKILKILKAHVIKLMCAGLNVNRQNHGLVFGNIGIDDSSNDEVQNSQSRFKSHCEQEIEQLKTWKIGENNITLYDILTKNIRSIARYAKNGSIMEFLESSTCHNQFPLYIDIMKNRFAEGVRRSELSEIAKKYSLSSIFHKLPHDCVDEVFSYLNTEDIKTFMEVVKAADNLSKKKSVRAKKCSK